MANTIGYSMLAMAFAMSFLLFWLVCFRTPAVMKTYRPVILCGWFADFLFNTFALVGRPLYFYFDGILYCVSAMLVSASHNYSINLAGILVWIYGFMALMITPSLQFLCRYLMVMRNVQLSSKRIFLLAIFWWAMPIAYVVLVYFTNQPTPHYWQIALEKFGREVTLRRAENGTTEFRYMLVVDMATSSMKFLFCLSMFIILCTYGSIVFFGYAIYRQFQRTNASNSQKKFQSAQRQITNILLVQAISPPIMGGVPFIYIFLMAALRIETPAWVVALFDHILAVVPIINPMLAIYFVRPYRNAVMGFCERLLGRTPRDASTSTIVGPISVMMTKDSLRSSDAHILG